VFTLDRIKAILRINKEKLELKSKKEILIQISNNTITSKIGLYQKDYINILMLIIPILTILVGLIVAYILCD